MFLRSSVIAGDLNFFIVLLSDVLAVCLSLPRCLALMNNAADYGKICVVIDAEVSDRTCQCGHRHLVFSPPNGIGAVENNISPLVTSGRVAARYSSLNSSNGGPGTST